MTIPAEAGRELFRILHSETHAPEGKMADPGCPLCADELPADRVVRDGLRRAGLGLLSPASARALADLLDPEPAR